MKIVIQVSARDDAKAWAIMQRHSPGVALPNRTFVVSEDSMQALTEAGIRGEGRRGHLIHPPMIRQQCQTLK